jgi:two-component system OmpR family response regulator
MIPRIRSTADHHLRVDAGDRVSSGPSCAEEVRGPVPQGSSRRIGASATKQILVIDDDPHVRELVARTVTRAGFRADTANDGENDWDAFRKAAYDLVITDNEMPGLTGLKLIERIRSFSIEPPFILISGNSDGVDSVLIQSVGPGVFLPKPFSPAALIEKVYGLLLHGEITEL